MYLAQQACVKLELADADLARLIFVYFKFVTNGFNALI